MKRQPDNKIKKKNNKNFFFYCISLQFSQLHYFANNEMTVYITKNAVSAAFIASAEIEWQ